MNYKIILSTKTTSAIFLAIVLFTGTIALSYPSFMIDAQAQPYYYDSGRDNNYNSYGPPEYPSYKPDYKAKYSSDNNNYKSKDSSKSVSKNKIKCINTNLNINGENSGDINLGNKGQGYLGAYSSDGGSDGGYGGSEGYYKQGKGSDCIINNNNTNINLVGAGNQTELLTCEECFTENLSVEQLNNLTDVLSNAPYQNLEGLCEALSNATGTNQIKLVVLVFIFNAAGITDEDTILRVLNCLDELGLIIVPPDFGLPNSMR